MSHTSDFLSMRVFVVALVLLVETANVALCQEKLPIICNTCECLGHTKPFDVDCMNMELHQVPDLSLSNFTFPWILNFANNLIHEVPELPKQEELLSINFKRNRIQSIGNGAFRNLPKLKELYLQSNNLTSDAITGDGFKGLYNHTYHEPLGLEVLDLSYNHIKFLRNHAFLHLRSLKRLFLAHNPLKDISTSTGMAINELVNLQELDLSQTGLDRLPNHFLTDLTNLQVLTLAGNNFNTVPGEINYAHNLRHLNLNANPILSLTLGDFQERLSTLRVLEISAMPQLRNVGSHTFSGLKSLEKLIMSSCPSLTVIDPLAFYVVEGDEMALKEIHIQDNHLQTLDESMLPWLQLQYVDIQNNPWDCDCHFKWVAKELIPDLERKNPGTTLSILCAEPDKDRGRPVVQLYGRSDSFLCNPPKPYSPDQAMFGPLAVGIIIVGTLLLLTGSMVFAYVLFRRSQSNRMFGETVKYRRAQNEDEEAVPS